ncbi:NAD-dependent deacylase [Algivirga pacifica]|uniref:NAD-dependent protein deacylase n=1 Tax=Algivirga pacifica TaxID=1162670 RepID=A0ABP9DHB8_9BACT
MKIAVLSGAGISAESGIATFRGADGLWEGHRIEEVASPEGWAANPDLVLDFYNQRRKQALEVEPNAAHYGIAALEQHHEVTVITQNVDNLHERAGSTNIIHLHGELFKSRSTVDESLVYEMDHWELKKGDLCEKGSQLRPHIVWFGEMVPMIEPSVEVIMQADVVIVVGTSMVVYPAAGLVDYARPDAPIYVVNPEVPNFEFRPAMVHYVQKRATEGVKEVVELLVS